MCVCAIFTSTCSCGCVFTYDHECSCSSVHMHVKARDQEQVPPSITPHLCLWDRASLRGWSSSILWAAGCRDPPTPVLLAVGSQEHTPSKLPSSGLHTCTAGTLPAAPSPSSPSAMSVHFRHGNSLCSPGWPGTPSADQAALKIKRDLSASASQVLRLKVSTAF